VSIVLSSSDEDGSQVTSTNDLQILTESSSNESENLPDTGLASDTCGHKQNAKTWTPHGTPQPIDATQLPFNIDGNVVYTLPYNNAKRMKSSLDGRPWKTWVTSSRKGFAGIRRIAHCKGSYKCYNIQCSYRKQYQSTNRTQFEKEEGETVCKCCGLRAVHIDCPATKVWEFPRNSQLVTITHTQESTHALLFLDKTRQNWRQYSLKILTCVLDKLRVNQLLMRSKQERHGKRL